MEYSFLLNFRGCVKSSYYTFIFTNLRFYGKSKGLKTCAIPLIIQTTLSEDVLIFIAKSETKTAEQICDEIFDTEMDCML